MNSALGIIKYNYKIILRTNLLIAIVYALILPFVVNFKLLTQLEVSRISELFISLIGIIILTSLIEVDYEGNIAEIISAKLKHKGTVFTYRLFIALAAMLILISLLYSYMIINDGNFHLLTTLAGTMITGLYLGMLGITAANLSRNLIVGYLISFTYYLVEFSTRGRYTGNFYLFGLETSNFTSKYYLLAFVVLMFIVNIVVLRKRSL
ncbi:MAG: hypothetical protein ACOC3B_03175 [Bacillota bacterium]